MTELEARQLPLKSLAYLGDAVLEIMVRRYLVCDVSLAYGEHPSKKSLEFVTAEAQAAALEKILPSLTEEEADIYRRGRNSVHANVPKHATIAEYRAATALECVFGYLYAQEKYSRLDELFRLGYFAKENEAE